MDDEIKQKINERYQQELNRGERFWPDSIFKDLVVSLGIFALLLVLAAFIGVAPEAKADPSDTSYLPRPEWYFLFLFKFLALYGQIPIIGKIEWLATVLIPSIGLGILTLLPFLDRSPYRHYSRRIFSLTVMGTVILDIVLLTVMASLPTAPDAAELAVSTTLQAIGGLWIPAAVLVVLIGLYVFRREIYQETTRRSLPLWVTVAGSIAMVAMTVVVSVRAAAYPKPEEVEVPTTLVDQIVAGQDLYSVQCVECHGDDGSVAVIEGVEGLEGEEITPINSRDVLYTITDGAMYEVIAYGRPNAGMPPFGKTYGGELSRSEIDYIILFMRYTWDDRFEAPVIPELFPPLAEGEVPSYDVHIAPIVKRYCVSCHRAGKDNNNYLMTSYEEILTTGDNVDHNLIAGDMNSYLLQVIQGTPIMDPADPTKELIGVMPPKTKLKSNVVDAFIRWVMNGMPKTAEEAAARSVTPEAQATTTP
ncbi:MAG: c-type cytochrome [Anaerolineales bacterium]|nr:c-type cytochrome [Anaerolineales bacterium]NUQ83334.1 c-type cytochrome [Anaerolineales bacterium]